MCSWPERSEAPNKRRSTDLAEERLNVAGLQLELLKDGWCCAVEMLKNTVVVTLCEVSLRQIKRVHQSQDVTVNKPQHCEREQIIFTKQEITLFNIFIKYLFIRLVLT